MTQASPHPALSRDGKTSIQREVGDPVHGRRRSPPPGPGAKQAAAFGRGRGGVGGGP